MLSPMDENQDINSYLKTYSVKFFAMYIANIRIKSTDKQALFDSGMDDEEKWEITNKWKITYTPYCGGRHRLTIKVEDVLTHVKEITVLGRPPVGSTVMCGPDSHSTVEGTVVSRSAYFSDSSTVNVQVQERFGYYHRSTTTNLKCSPGEKMEDTKFNFDTDAKVAQVLDL